MSKYELAVIYHPTLEVDLSKGEAQFEKIINTVKAKIISSDNWGKRKLAYPIKHQDHGIYVFYQVEIEPKAVGKLESALNISDEIIRYLIVKPDERAPETAKKTTKKVSDEEEKEEDEPKEAPEEAEETKEE